MNIWTVEMVEARLAEAAEVIRRLPPVRVPDYFNTWPLTERGLGDRGREHHLAPPRPSSVMARPCSPASSAP